MTNRTITRRRFCRALAALAGAPAVVPGRALGADGAVAASNRIQLACIGLGGRVSRSGLEFSLPRNKR